MGRFVWLFVATQLIAFVAIAQNTKNKNPVKSTTVVQQKPAAVKTQQATNQPATAQPTYKQSVIKPSTQPGNNQPSGTQPSNTQPTTNQPTNNYSVYNPPAQVSFSGRVFDQKTRAALAGVLVQVVGENGQSDLSLRTNADGAYSFDARKFKSLQLSVQMNGYENYLSQVYQPSVMYRRENTRFDDIFLVQITKPNPPPDNHANYPTNPNPTTTNPSHRLDSTPTERYLNQKLFTDFHVLPTSSAYALYYALNPQLKNATNVPSAYDIRRPQTREFTQTMKRDFSSGFKYDSEKDPVVQTGLTDSIDAYVRFYDGTLKNTTVKYNDVNADSTAKIFSIIKTDLLSYRNQVSNTRRAKATQLTNAVTACTDLIRDISAKAEINREDYDQLVALGSCLSTMVKASSFIDFFKRLFDDLSLAKPVNPLRLNKDDGSVQFASFRPTNSPPQEAQNSFADEFTNDTRAFTVSVHVQLPDTVISDGNDISNRYDVVFFPPKLKAIKGLRIVCKPAATFGRVSLYEGKFEQMVIDRRTGREMTIIDAGDNSFNTLPAFSKPARQLLGLGDTNFTEIQILIRQ